MGTPYVLAEQKACYLCMACCRLCPTGALDRDVVNPEKVSIGQAVIEKSICYSHLFLDHDVLPDTSGKKIGALCNTCYNVCPLSGEGHRLEEKPLPEVTDACVGCGICVERCPTRPKRAINVVPSGMGRVDEAGFYFRKAKVHYESSGAVEKQGQQGVLKGEKLIEQKSRIDGSKEAPKFDFPYKAPTSIEGWD